MNIPTLKLPKFELPSVKKSSDADRTNVIGFMAFGGFFITAGIASSSWAVACVGFLSLGMMVFAALTTERYSGN